MRRRELLKLAALLPAAAKAQFRAILTRGYDNTRACANDQETTLTPANVAGLRKLYSLPMEGDARGAEAQPLFVPGLLTEDGLKHNAVIVCSMNNLVYCFDCDNSVGDESAILWTQKLGTPINGSTQIDMWKINDHWGILSTPVIDQDAGLMYLTAWSSPDGTPDKGTYSIHVLNLKNGTHAKPPVSLAGVSYSAGNGIPVQKWAAGMRKQRSSLLLTNVNGVKTVFFGAGSVYETSDGVSGWIVAYDIASGTLTACATAPHYYGAGIWMAGQGLAADEAGNIYGVTGNGGFDGITDFAESYFRAQYTPPRAGAAGTLKIVDWWSPFSDAGRIGKAANLPTAEEMKIKVAGVSAPSESKAESVLCWAGRNDESGDRYVPCHPADRVPVNSMGGFVMHAHARTAAAANTAGFSDQDLGSSGINIIPELGIAFGSGKDGILYVLDLNNMGRTALSDFLNPAANYAKLKAVPIWYTYFPGVGVSATPANSADLDVFFADRTHHMHSTSAVFKTSAGQWRAFCWGENGNLRAWSIDASGTFTYLGCSAEVASPQSPVPYGGMPGGMLSISSNNGANALLWATVPLGDANHSVTQGNLYCYDALNLGTYADGSGALRLLWKSPTYAYNKFCPPVVNGGRVFIPNYSGGVDVYGLN